MAPYENYDSYKPDYGKSARRRAGSGIADYVMSILTALFCLMLAAAYLSPLINPVDFWPFALFGLAAPILYIVCTMLMLYWVVRWRRIAFLPMAVLLLGAGYVSRLAKPTLGKNQTSNIDKSALKVLSYNVRGLIDFEESGTAFSTAAAVMELVEEIKPDIICFQEYQTTPLVGRDSIDRMLGWLPYKRIHFKVTGADGSGWGNAIYSRYPIIDSKEVEFSHSTNSAQWADIVIRRDTVRLFNAHLQSFLFTAADRDFINEELGFNSPESKIRTILGKLKRGYITRAGQADTLSGVIRDSPHETIVCGDFNDTPMSYVYSTVRGGLKDSFIEQGRGLVSNTYREFFSLFRIDYVLYSDKYRALSYQVGDSDLSDHKPVIVALKRKR